MYKVYPDYFCHCSVLLIVSFDCSPFLLDLVVLYFYQSSVSLVRRPVPRSFSYLLELHASIAFDADLANRLG